MSRGVCTSVLTPERGVGSEEMRTPEDLLEMRRLHGLGWRKPAQRRKRRVLVGWEGWLRDRLAQHEGNADVVRQELGTLGVRVSLRTVQRTVEPFRRELRVAVVATTRFETPPGYQLQIDFGERQVWIGGEKRRVTLFVATLGCSRRMHVRVFLGERQRHWFEGLESTFEEFGGVPETVLLDNARAWHTVGETESDPLDEAGRVKVRKVAPRVDRPVFEGTDMAF